MKRTLKLLSISALSAFLLVGGGCSSGSGDKEPAKGGTTLTLSTSSTSILANGEDAAQLSAYYSGTQSDVTAQAEFFANDQALPTSEFTTTTAGSYTIKAVYEGVTSNTITITAVSGESAQGIRLESSKSTVYPDGGDFAVLTLKNQSGADVTAQGTFYANGEELEGNRFSTTKGSTQPVTITAKFNGHDVEGSVQIYALSTAAFTSRMLLEDITKTNCTNCPTVIRLIDENLRKDNPQTVVAYSIHNSGSDIYKNYYSETTQAFADAFYPYMEINTEGLDAPAPQVYLNRNKTKIDYKTTTAEELRYQAQNGPKDVAIAMESSRTESTVTVTVTVGTKRAFSGKIVAVLVESGIKANQWDMGLIEMYRIMRGYAPSMDGEPKSFEANSTLTYTTSFDLSKTTVKDINNCELIVFVTDNADGLCENVQYAKVGEAKGY